MLPVPLYQWVSEHNPAPELSYGKGWWDTIECIYRLQDTYQEALTVTVVRTFTMHTPPPPEQLLMPTFRLHHEEVDALLRCDFSHPIKPPWVVSIQRRQKVRVPLYGLIDEHLALEPREVSGFDPAWVYPCYSSDAARFTCALSEEWKLYALLWILTHPAPKADEHSLT